MKKWQLLKICENVNIKKLKYTSYNDLLNFTEEQINIIITNINKETIPTLIEFFSLLNKGKYDFSKFEQLGIFDIKEIMFNRILYAEAKQEAILALNWFRYKIDKFKTDEEWFLFMNNLSNEFSLCNLSYIIDTFEISRIEAIEKVMKNATKLRTIYLCDVNKKKRFKENNLLDIIDLIIMGYNVKFSTKLVKQLVKTKQDKLIYDEIINYLKHPVLFHEDLPKLFLDIGVEQLSSIIEILEKIDNQNILDKYLSYNLKNEQLKILNEYVDRVIKETNPELKKSLILLLDNKENFESLITEDTTKLDLVLKKLEMIDIKDERCIIMAKLLEVIPYDKWIQIPSDIDIEKLEYIYQNNKTFLDIIDVVDLELLLAHIRKISLINLKKIFAIFRLKSFTSKLKNNNDIYNLFDLSKENYIDNIYKKYLLEEGKNKLLRQTNITRIDSSYELELIKLYNILENGYDIDLVLDTYQDNEELDGKTLIKIFTLE